MSLKEGRAHPKFGSDRQNVLPMSRTSILSKTLSVSNQSSQKDWNSSIEEILVSGLAFIHAIYQLQLQRDASFLG